MYYNVLHCIIMYYSVLQCTIMYFSVLQCTAIYYNVLPGTSVYYNVLHYTTLYYSVLQCTSVYSVLQCPKMLQWSAHVLITSDVFNIKWHEFSCNLKIFDVICDIILCICALTLSPIPIILCGLSRSGRYILLVSYGESYIILKKSFV